MSRPMSAHVDLAADVEAVYAVLTGDAWPTALDAELHDGSTLVSSEPTGDGGVVLVTSRRLPDGVPGPLKRFAPSDGRVTQTDRWQGPAGGTRSGTWAVTFPGSPGTMAGVTTVEPLPDGCRWTVRGDVRIAIPVVGGRVEGFLVPLLEKLVLRQGEVLQAQLA